MNCLGVVSDLPVLKCAFVRAVTRVYNRTIDRVEYQLWQQNTQSNAPPEISYQPVCATMCKTIAYDFLANQQQIKCVRRTHVGKADRPLAYFVHKGTNTACHESAVASQPRSPQVHTCLDTQLQTNGRAWSLSITISTLSEHLLRQRNQTWRDHALYRSFKAYTNI